MTFLVYLLLIPYLVRFIGVPNALEINVHQFIFYMIFFVVLGSFSSAFSGTIYGFLLSAISKMLGFLILLYFSNGGIIEGSAAYGNYIISVRLDITPILIIIFFITVAFIFADAWELIEEKP